MDTGLLHMHIIIHCGIMNTQKKESEKTDSGVAFFLSILYYYLRSAGMAELADALASGASDRKVVQVQVLFPAPRKGL